MNIKSITISNFKGFAGERKFDLPKKVALLGNNGKGKTSFMQALLYGLTGIKPDGDIIYSGENRASVTITLPLPGGNDDISFTRQENRDKPNKWFVDKKSCSQKEFEKELQDIIGIPLENIKQVANGDIVAAMANNPDDLSGLLLKYLPKKLTIEEVLGFFEGEDSAKQLVIEGLPAKDITIDNIDAFESFVRDIRKSTKETLARKKAIRDRLPLSEEKPIKNKAEIEKEINALVNIEAKAGVAKQALHLYEKALAARMDQEKKIAEAEKQLAEINVTRPDPSLRTKLQEEGQKAQETIRNIEKSVGAMQASRGQLQITLESLNKPICPISPLITCHENKTVAIKDISAAIEQLVSAEKAAEEEKKKAKEHLQEINFKANALTEQILQYNKKLQLAQSIKLIKENLSDIPEKPEEFKVPEDLEEKKKTLQAELRNIDSYEIGLKLDKEIENLKHTVNDYDAIVKNFTDKGPVKNGIVNMFLGIFNQVCNDICRIHRPEIDFKFVNDKGVLVLMNNGKGSYLPYASLSKGEESFMLFVLMSMLNKLTGSGLLLLDELSVLDSEVFDKLLDIINDSSSEFDHVIFTAVDHDDIKKQVLSHTIPEFVF